MRDDIHRSAPVPRAWRRLMQTCSREAGYVEDSSSAARAALACELREGFSPDFSAQYRATFTAGGDGLFPTGVREHLASNAATRGDFIVVSRLQTGEPVTNDKLMAAMNFALRELMKSRIRQVEAHAAINDPFGGHILLSRLSTAIHSVSLPDLVEQWNRGATLVPPSKRMAFDVDADLRGKP
jgi:hypothetical protein